LIPKIVGGGDAGRVGDIAAGGTENGADVARLRVVEEVVDAEVEADLGFGGDAPVVADRGGGDPIARRVDDGEGVDFGVVDALRGIRGVDDRIGAAVTDDGAAAVARAAAEAQSFETPARRVFQLATAEFTSGDRLLTAMVLLTVATLAESMRPPASRTIWRRVARFLSM
jgi:hypothetical protein